MKWSLIIKHVELAALQEGDRASKSPVVAPAESAPMGVPTRRWNGLALDRYLWGFF